MLLPFLRHSWINFIQFTMSRNSLWLLKHSQLLQWVKRKEIYVCDMVVKTIIQFFCASKIWSILFCVSIATKSFYSTWTKPNITIPEIRNNIIKFYATDKNGKEMKLGKEKGFCGNELERDLIKTPYCLFFKILQSLLYIW